MVKPSGERPKGPSGVCNSTWCAASQSCPETCSGSAYDPALGAAIAHTASVSAAATSQPPAAMTTAVPAPTAISDAWLSTACAARPRRSTASVRSAAMRPENPADPYSSQPGSRSSHTQSSGSDPGGGAEPFSGAGSVSIPASGGAAASTGGCGLSAMAPMLGAETCANSAGAPVLHPSEGRARLQPPGRQRLAAHDDVVERDVVARGVVLLRALRRSRASAARSRTASCRPSRPRPPALPSWPARCRRTRTRSRRRGPWSCPRGR